MKKFKVMKKSDVKSGYLVVINTNDERGKIMAIISNTLCKDDDENEYEGLGVTAPNYWCPFDKFDEDLKYHVNANEVRVIEEVYGFTHNRFALDLDTFDRELLWKRD